MRITAVVSRGEHKGSILEPHPYPDGKYVVSKSKFKRDYVYVRLDQIRSKVLTEGLSLRMSDPVTHKHPCLISPSSICFS